MSRLPSISSLMSPPEARPLDHSDKSVCSPELSNRKYAQERKPGDEKLLKEDVSVKIPPSPPDSPWRKEDHYSAEDRGRCDIEGPGSFRRDAVLYPDEGDCKVKGPLFGTRLAENEQAKVVEQHMRCHYLVPKSRGTQGKRFEMPTKEEYMLMANCVSRIGEFYNRSPGAYLKRSRAEVDEKRGLSKRRRFGVRQLHHLNERARAQHYRPVQNTHLSKAMSSTEVARPPVILPGNPMSRPRQDVRLALPSSPAKKSEPINSNFNDIPDYSPPLSTLPNHPRSLSVEWQGSALDLSEDPNRHLLHEAELYLASKLRLSCANYLGVKRRIFVGRVNNFARGKKFTKTDAQSCGHIDVNKSSKIWTAYEKVGWFDRQHFTAAINAVTSSSRCFDPASQSFLETIKFLSQN